MDVGQGIEVIEEHDDHVIVKLPPEMWMRHQLACLLSAMHQEADALLQAIADPDLERGRSEAAAIHRLRQFSTKKAQKLLQDRQSKAVRFRRQSLWRRRFAVRVPRATRSRSGRQSARSAAHAGHDPPGRSTGGSDDDEPPRLKIPISPISAQLRSAAAAGVYFYIFSVKTLSIARQGMILRAFAAEGLGGIDQISQELKVIDPERLATFRALKLAGLSLVSGKRMGSGLLQAQGGDALGISISLLMPKARPKIKGCRCGKSD